MRRRILNQRASELGCQLRRVGHLARQLANRQRLTCARDIADARNRLEGPTQGDQLARTRMALCRPGDQALEVADVFECES